MTKNLIITVTALIVMLVVNTSCSSQGTSSAGDNTSAQAAQESEKTVTVYYFHGDRRCTTCKAVGSVSKTTIEEHFANNPKVVFSDINIDDPVNNELKDRMEMSGSGLFIFNGEIKEDLTAIAFQKAVDHPEELEEKIIETVNLLL